MIVSYGVRGVEVKICNSKLRLGDEMWVIWLEGEDIYHERRRNKQEEQESNCTVLYNSPRLSLWQQVQEEPTRHGIAGHLRLLPLWSFSCPSPDFVGRWREFCLVVVSIEIAASCGNVLSQHRGGQLNFVDDPRYDLIKIDDRLRS